MEPDLSEQSLTEWEIEQIGQRIYLNFSQYHLVMVRGLMRQWQIDNERAHLIAMSRFPMSSHTAIDEIAVRGLQVTLADIEEFWFELTSELIDTNRLQWSAKSIENFILWAVSRDRAKPIESKAPFIQKLLRDREFVIASHEFETAITNSLEPN